MTTAEIIAIGTELANGSKRDTNSQWLSRELVKLGISPQLHSVVADHFGLMLQLFQQAVTRSDLILMTGGLGPTQDDITRDVLAKLMNVALELDEGSLAVIEERFARRQRIMSESNKSQAMFPAGSTPLKNPYGTAPGIWMEIPRSNSTSCRIAAFPGIPFEMKKMFQEQVLPRISGTGMIIQQVELHCFGLGESELESRLGSLTARGRDPEVGITVHEGTITLRIVTSAKSLQVCEEKIDLVRSELTQRLGHLIFGEGEATLQQSVIQLLEQSQQTLSTAEIGTGGFLAHLLTEIPSGSSGYLGGMVFSADENLKQLFKEHAIASERDIASQSEMTESSKVALQLANLARIRFQSDYALGVAEQSPLRSVLTSDESAHRESSEENLNSPAPDIISIGLSGDDISIVEHVTLTDDPSITKSRCSKAALNMLRNHLLSAGTESDPF